MNAQHYITKCGTSWDTLLFTDKSKNSHSVTSLGNLPD